jgi:DNA mismatch repair ATPase MutS
MKVNLLYKNKDFKSDQELPQNANILLNDLGLDVVLKTMADGDELIYDIAKKVMFNSLTDIEEITYRQEIIKDSINNPDVVREIFNVAREAIARKREWFFFGISTISISSLMYSSVSVLQALLEELRKLRKIAQENAQKFHSAGFTRLFNMLQDELSEDYLKQVSKVLEDLRFKDGMLISAELGNYNRGVNYVLRKPREGLKYKIKWKYAPKFCIHPRDENGGVDLTRRQERAMNLAANALAQSADHVVNFFYMLRDEIAFYVGAINLYEKLKSFGLDVTFPTLNDYNEKRHSFEDLYDVSLALLKEGKVVPNTLNLDGKELVFITGANQGGKTTFLRSVGQAQVMLQSGMFVGAKSFSANIASGIFTHFIKEEDVKLESGKLEEELSRLSEIVKLIKPNAIVLFNESFSSTNEREGSEIARQVIRAFLENNIKIFFVTHFFDLANSFYEMKSDKFAFLRAERNEKGERTFRVLEGAPLETSFGVDVYKKIFGSVPIEANKNKELYLWKKISLQE